MNDESAFFKRKYMLKRIGSPAPSTPNEIEASHDAAENAGDRRIDR